MALIFVLRIDSLFIHILSGTSTFSLEAVSRRPSRRSVSLLTTNFISKRCFKSASRHKASYEFPSKLWRSQGRESVIICRIILGRMLFLLKLLSLGCIKFYHYYQFSGKSLIILCIVELYSTVLVLHYQHFDVL